MKNNLKEKILAKRNSLSKDEITEKSRKIEEKLFSLEQYNNSKTIMFFVSFNSEVNTHEMIKKTLGSKTVVVPKVLQSEIEPSVIIDFDSLVPSGKFGILEPIEIMKTAYKNIDLVLVPGAAFDNKGHRIGYGFGYYDKFLAKVKKSIKIGLAFDFQVVDSIPNEKHDVPVDLIVTEERVIECKNS
ncbi:5-formyltetrahydrofolate cyclo-ligase [Candidatus Woesearchaeota archaeon]|jgi:5-formyltetrahydrofolate cyclo-ligase|nr:5-formyltetrahydrofolate cyclo-ligase [Candidatus Woesearchaeota archaeon]MAG91681.1 5-formyltetrahydrofolate cyclo-ligase [Candidatus Woesearchaeota archaeon]|tara:strand:- start:15670 stop:16227 length:558 start_codon:yes stop_codon:yes gene_type:complete